MDGAQRILCQAKPDPQIGRRFEGVPTIESAAANIS